MYATPGVYPTNLDFLQLSRAERAPVLGVEPQPRRRVRRGRKRQRSIRRRPIDARRRSWGRGRHILGYPRTTHHHVSPTCRTSSSTSPTPTPTFTFTSNTTTFPPLTPLRSLPLRVLGRVAHYPVPSPPPRHHPPANSHDKPRADTCTRTEGSGGPWGAARGTGGG